MTGSGVDMVHVRRATSDDTHAISRVHVLSWQTAYAGLLPADLLATLSVESRLTFWSAELESPSSPDSTTWVVEADDDVVGFASTGRCRDADRSDPSEWELFAIYLLPEFWGHRLGARLASTALENLPTRARSVSLWVLAGNHRAIAFYEAIGFQRDGSVRTELIGGEPLDELRLVRSAAEEDGRRGLGNGAGSGNGHGDGLV